jgi:hypothetical protein
MFLLRLQRNRNRDSCEKNATGPEKTGIWRIPAGITNLAGSGGFFVSSPNNDCKGGIDSMIGGGGPIDPQALCGVGNNDGNKDYTQPEACIGRDSISLFPHVCKGFVNSTREIEDTIVAWFSRVLWAVGRGMPIGSSRYM